MYFSISSHHIIFHFTWATNFIFIPIPFPQLRHTIILISLHCSPPLLPLLSYYSTLFLLLLLFPFLHSSSTAPTHLLPLLFLNSSTSPTHPLLHSSIPSHHSLPHPPLITPLYTPVGIMLMSNGGSNSGRNSTRERACSSDPAGIDLLLAPFSRTSSIQTSEGSPRGGYSF